MKLKVLKELSKKFPQERIVVEKNSLTPYSYDETPGFSNFPLAVVKPVNTQEVVEVVNFALSHKIPITPRGGGTGLSGGAVPSEGSVVVSFELMNKIKKIDTKNLLTIVEPGVITGELARVVKKYHLMYPPDPASLNSSTIGGNITECAGGARTVKYGTTKNYVLGLEVVLPTGEVIRCGGKVVKNVVGYSLLDLFIGSEGTLGIITEAILKLIPLTLHRITLLILYKSLPPLLTTVEKLLTQKILPTAIEFMEERAIEATKEYGGKGSIFLNYPANCLLLVEIDGNYYPELENAYEVLGKIALKEGAIDVFVAEDNFQQQKLWEARRGVSEALKRKGEVDHEDVVVPRGEILRLVKEIRKLEKKYNTQIACYGHVGDGNVHVNILQGNMEKKEWKNRVKKLVKELFQFTISIGGTISGEHGIGLAKKPYLSLALGKKEIKVMKRIKKMFDPYNILNPGKIF